MPTLSIPLNTGVFPMFTRFLTALDRFEDSPLGSVLGLVVLLALAVLPLALNEGGW